MAEGRAPIRVLVVDDDAVDRELVIRLLRSDFAVVEAATAREAREKHADVECVLLDNRLPDSDGLDLLPELLEQGLPVLVLTGQGNESIAVEAMKRGACDYLPKDRLARETLTRAIRSALETTALRRRVERQQAEIEASYRLLADREARLGLLLEQMPAVLWSTDAELRYTSASGAGLRAIGVTSAELLGKHAGEVGAPDVHVEAQRKALGGTPARYDFVFRGRTLKSHVEPLRDDAGNVCGVVGVAVDVSETARLELELRHGQKMDAIGRLAGGVAHDFNNILTVIKSFGAFVLEDLREDDPKRDDMKEVLNASDRAVALVRQLLAFSRRQTANPQVVDAAELVRAMLPMLGRLVGESVALRFEADRGAWRTLIDPGGLEQIVVNLVVNARDAMPDGGAITLTVGNASLDESVSMHEDRLLPRGDYVVLSVTDEGTGIAPEIRERIFEPFFTTKEPGRGTGLGLATCYGIAQQAGGAIVVYSEPEIGSTFRIYLPRTTSGADTQPISRPGPARGGDETVLVVEDDQPVRALVVRSLKRYGYRVVEVSDAREVVRAVEEHGEPIHLVVADVIMPHVRGPEVVRRVRERRPAIKALFVSGYSAEAARQRELLEPGVRMLEKPFTAEVLARAVREVLDG